MLLRILRKQWIYFDAFTNNFRLLFFNQKLDKHSAAIPSDGEWGCLMGWETSSWKSLYIFCRKYWERLRVPFLRGFNRKPLCSYNPLKSKWGERSQSVNYNQEYKQIILKFIFLYFYLTPIWLSGLLIHRVGLAVLVLNK